MRNILTPAYTSTTPVNAPLNNVSLLEYWQVDRTIGAGNANLSLYWEDASASGINNCADLTMARWNGSSWDERVATTAVASSCSGTGAGTVVSTAVITAFSPFTFGSKLTSVNPLPIHLLDFQASCKTNEVEIKWNTATESNNNYFILERSINGVEWTDIGHVKGAGNSSEQRAYSFSDRLVSDQNLYYKLSQVDLDGKKESLNVVTTNCFPSTETMLVYPNPASNELTFQFDLTKNYGTGLVKVIDNMGRVCLQQRFDLLKGKNSFTLPLNLSPGSYSILFLSEELILPARKLIVK